MCSLNDALQSLSVFIPHTVALKVRESPLPDTYGHGRERRLQLVARTSL